MKFDKDRRYHETLFWDHGTDDVIKPRLATILTTLEKIVSPCFNQTTIARRLLQRITFRRFS